MQTAEEIAATQTPEEMADIICRQFGLETPLHLIRDAIATAITAKCAAERARCIALVRTVGDAHGYSAAEYASGAAVDDIVRRIALAIANADQPGA